MAIQGKAHDIFDIEYVSEFSVDYSRDGRNWTTAVAKAEGVTSGTNDVKYYKFDQPLIARVVRLYAKKCVNYCTARFEVFFSEIGY